MPKIRLATYYRIYKAFNNPKLRYVAINALKLAHLRYLVVKFDPNWLCNLKCRMCYFSRDDYKSSYIKPMSIDLFDKIARDVFPKCRILFLGCSAEPLMSPEFPRYADIVGNYGIPFVSVVTNGQLLNYEVVSSMIRNNFNEVIISVDGASASTYENIRVGASFEKLLANLEMIKVLKKQMDKRLPEVRFNFTAMKNNIGELHQLIDIAVELDVKTIRARSLGEWGGVLEFAEQVLSKVEYNAAMENASRYAQSRKVEFLFDGCFDSTKSDIQIAESSNVCFKALECILPWYSLFIRGDGKVRHCSWQAFENGDLSQNSLGEIEQSSVMVTIKRNLRENPAKSCLTICKSRFGGL